MDEVFDLAQAATADRVSAYHERHGGGAPQDRTEPAKR